MGLNFDEGIHVSFTKNEWVRKFLQYEASTHVPFREFEPQVSSYFRGTWLPHPIQLHWERVSANAKVALGLQDLSFTGIRAARTWNRDEGPLEEVGNYEEWLDGVFGVFARRTFFEPYTQKYWRTPSRNLAANWVGGRIASKDASNPVQSKHYIEKIRYPKSGRFADFFDRLVMGTRIRYQAAVAKVDLANKQVALENGEKFNYDILVNTLPLPHFCALTESPLLQSLARCLQWTSVKLDDFVLEGVNPYRQDSWGYVYDLEIPFSRFSQPSMLSSPGGPGAGDKVSSIQTETYFSSVESVPEPSMHQALRRKIMADLGSMDLLDVESARIKGERTRLIKYANVAFHLDTESVLDEILTILEHYGLIREADDTHPLSEWNEDSYPTVPEGAENKGSLFLAGRFAQWKYFWTDDCILRARQISAMLGRQ